MYENRVENMYRKRILGGGGLVDIVSPTIPASEGLYIAFHTFSGKISAVSPDEWPELERAGYIADGIAVFNNGSYDPYIIGPTYKKMKGLPSSDPVYNIPNINTVATFSGKGADGTPKVYQFNTKKPKELTKVFIDYFGDTQDYSFSWCYNYSNGNIGKGKWWFDGGGRLYMIPGKYWETDNYLKCINVLKCDNNFTNGYTEIAEGISELDTYAHFVAFWGGMLMYQSNGAGRADADFGIIPMTDFID